MKRRGTLTVVLLAGVAALVAVFAGAGSAQSVSRSMMRRVRARRSSAV